MPERRRRGRTPPVAREPLGPEQALEVAARFLATRPRTRWEVRRRLERAGVTDPLLEATLERLEGLGLVDDAAFAAWWRDQRDRHAPRGQRLLESELRAKGVPREVIATLRETKPERVPEDALLPATEGDRAREALAGHLRGRPLPTDAKALQRIGMYLVRRGFDPATSRTVIRELAARDDLLEDAESRARSRG